MTRENVGKIITDLRSTQQYEMELGELQQSEFDRYNAKLEQLMEQGKQEFSGNFYIEILPKRERTMIEILPRILGKTRSTCPTPFLDQDVYMYNRKDDVLEFMWTLPELNQCKRLKMDALRLDQFDREVLKYVLDYESGVLFKLMKILNNEKEDSLELKDFTFKG